MSKKNRKNRKKNKNNKNYFSYIFFTLLFSVFAFLIFKNYLPERLFPETQVKGENIIIDSLALNAIAESQKNKPDAGDNIETDDAQTDSTGVKLSPDSLIFKDNIISPTKNMEGLSYMVSFFEKLLRIKNGEDVKVRIAYFSDSMTDGDLIVQDIRKEFQKNYGGKGVGFVGITSLSAGSRYSVTHRYSSNWNTQSFLKTQRPKRPFGIDGQVSFANGGTYTLTLNSNGIENSEYLNQPMLFFGKSGNEKAYVNIYADKDTVVRKDLKASNTLNTVRLTTANPKKIKIELHKADTIPFYGLNFDDGKGVHIDNFSLRGNSGLPLSLLNTNLMQAFDRTLNYDLIILHYGANVLSYGAKDYIWYEDKMANVVRHLKVCFPNASVLIISTSDKAVKINGTMQTDPAVEILLNSQKRYARKTGSAFLNLYNLMGGYGSMVKWVQEKPVSANKDYTHFNIDGSKRIALLIYKEIEKGLQKYLNKDIGIDESEYDTENIEDKEHNENTDI